jgi:predicted nuclease of restriction endonuclease-like (RecB) superfamily
VSHLLTWSHYFELLKIDNELERQFYQQQTIKDSWSVRELKRYKTSALFQRLALSKDKKSILALAKKGHTIEKDIDIVKDPYVLEFLNIPEKYKYSEKELEQKIIDNLQDFLLELGKGFAFIGRQYRVTLNNKHYRIDLVFYHRILKCFIIVDLKINDVEHNDIGQINMYLGYFETEMNVSDDNPPIGIILTAEKDAVMVEYAMHGISNKIFVSKYQLYLPDKKTLQKKVQQILDKE